MLILSRRRGESIQIGDNITVTVSAVHGNQVKLGITAPATMAVHRAEVAKRIAAEGGAGVTAHLPLEGGAT